MLTRRHFVITTATMFSGPIASPLLAQETATSEVTTEAAAAVEPVKVKRRPVSNSAMWNSYDARVTPANYDPMTSNPWGLKPRLLPRIVHANDGLKPGDIHVDAVARYLYHIRDDGTAMRYGVAIGRSGLYEPGVYTVGRKTKWPTWTPTKDMIEREPHKYKKYEDGMDGGPSNPLGSRALYLYEGRRDTYLRIHGSPQPRSIGSRASSGCVRMVMAHIIGLYEQVETGVTAHLYPA
ncbi:L,D-transpeptidase [Aliiroseovarius sp. S1123]|jgi:lipoprotein-anchoring transpeptidase ErfK/SrfK|uniref:L,D-transpeptidase n=1 Tax=unclassified Aliiroseovarius TaxID=2623558 RepID=UPI001FF21B5B|nr:L,D-transpeptidase [Aliiroseovarius sp. S1123]MCK0172482.1 L,D-transpeptidase [Aliiroseovarius sp. S1123]